MFSQKECQYPYVNQNKQLQIKNPKYYSIIRNMHIMSDEILEEVLDSYLTSRDFNGLPFTLNEIKTSRLELQELVKAEKISLYWDSENPHIRRFPDKSIEEQLEWLSAQDDEVEVKNLPKTKNVTFEFIADTVLCCIYPTPKYLKETQSKNKFSNKPFSRMLLFGEAQMKPIYFKPKVLYEYRDDPLYELSRSGVSGSISYFGKNDNFFLSTFGVGLSKDLSKYEVTVVVYLTYLKDLDSFNQKRWYKYILSNQDKYEIHRDYFIPSILGSWEFNESPYIAFLKEIKIINAMSKASFGRQMFKKDFEPKELPLFSYILIPTKKEFNDFAKTLNNIFVDNLDEKFFKEQGIKNRDVEGAKGTIKLLEEWIRENFETADFGPIDKIFTVMRKDIRRVRSKSSHKEMENIVDNSYFEKQRVLINKAYEAIRTLRLILANHPEAKKVQVPDWLFKGKISKY